MTYNWTHTPSHSVSRAVNVIKHGDVDMSPANLDQSHSLAIAVKNGYDSALSPDRLRCNLRPSNDSTTPGGPVKNTSIPANPADVFHEVADSVKRGAEIFYACMLQFFHVSQIVQVSLNPRIKAQLLRHIAILLSFDEARVSLRKSFIGCFLMVSVRSPLVTSI